MSKTLPKYPDTPVFFWRKYLYFLCNVITCDLVWLDKPFWTYHIIWTLSLLLYLITFNIKYIPIICLTPQVDCTNIYQYNCYCIFVTTFDTLSTIPLVSVWALETLGTSVLIIIHIIVAPSIISVVIVNTVARSVIFVVVLVAPIFPTHSWYIVPTIYIQQLLYNVCSTNNIYK